MLTTEIFQLNTYEENRDLRILKLRFFLCSILYFEHPKRMICLSLTYEFLCQAWPKEIILSNLIIWSSEFRLRVWGLGLGLWAWSLGLGLLVWGLRFEAPAYRLEAWGLRLITYWFVFSFWDLSFEVWGLRFEVWGLRFNVSGFGSWLLGLRSPLRSNNYFLYFLFQILNLNFEFWILN